MIVHEIVQSRPQSLLLCQYILSCASVLHIQLLLLLAVRLQLAHKLIILYSNMKNYKLTCKLLMKPLCSLVKWFTFDFDARNRTMYNVNRRSMFQTQEHRHALDVAIAM